MSTVITPEMVREAYKVAKQVYEEKLSRQDGVEELVGRMRYNRSSAADAIDNLGHMLNGEGYKRLNNLFTTTHFLEMIHRDYGAARLRRALSALEQHLDYYDRVETGGPQPGQRAILAKFLGVADQEEAGRGSDGLTEQQRAGLAREEHRLRQDGAFDPTDVEDARRRTLANIVSRQGQGTFRTTLLELYNGRCAVSGCAVEVVLEAAHITPYLGPRTNDPTNGLLLRSDIHALFDLGLVAVETKDMTVLVAKPLDGSEYEALRGRPLQLPEGSLRPSVAALDRHRHQSGVA